MLSQAAIQHDVATQAHIVRRVDVAICAYGARLANPRRRRRDHKTLSHLLQVLLAVAVEVNAGLTSTTAMLSAIGVLVVHVPLSELVLDGCGHASRIREQLC